MFEWAGWGWSGSWRKKARAHVWAVLSVLWENSQAFGLQWLPEIALTDMEKSFCLPSWKLAPSSSAPVYCGYASDLWHKAPPCLVSWTWYEIVFLSGRFGQGSKLGVIKGFSLLHMKKKKRKKSSPEIFYPETLKKQTDKKKDPATPIAMGRITSSGGYGIGAGLAGACGFFSNILHLLRLCVFTI